MKISGIGPWFSQINWCKGHWCGSTIIRRSLNTCSSFHVCFYVLGISKTAAATQTVPGIRDLAVKIILQKLFCFADKFRKLLTLQFNSCFLYNRTVYNRARVCVKSYLWGGKKCWKYISHHSNEYDYKCNQKLHRTFFLISRPISHGVICIHS